MADIDSANFQLVINDQAMNKFITRMTKRLRDIDRRDRKLVDQISPPVFRNIVQHFEQERGPDGGWADWSDVYKEHLAKIGRLGNKKLQFNGDLKKGIKPSNWRVQREGILWFNNAKTKTGFPYAAAHDEGGPKLPQRQYMWIDNKTLDVMARITLAYMTRR